MGEKREETSKWPRYFKKNNLGKRLILGCISLIACMVYVHFKQVQVKTLKLDSYAKNYVVAQIDFEFPDEEGTFILRQESARDINTIYKIDPTALETCWFQLENFLIYDQHWRTLLPKSTFEELYQGADAIKNLLAKARFTDARTLQRLNSLQLKKPNYFLLPTSFDGKFATFSDEFWENIQHILDQQKKEKKIQGVGIRYILGHFQATRWVMEKDTSLQLSLQGLVESTVSARFRQIKAGMKIVDQGEKITQRHIAMIQAMKQALTKNQKIWEPLPLLSNVIFAVIITLIGSFYFLITHREIIYDIHKLALYVTIIILTMLIAKVSEYLIVNNVDGLLERVHYPPLVPFASILLCVLLGEEVALFSTCFLSIIFGLTLAFDHTRLIAINFITGVVATLTSRLLRKRREVFVVCGKVWLCCIPILFMYSFSQETLWTSTILSDLLSIFFLLLITSVLIIGLLPILESLFHVMTDITLMEYMDPNNDLLRRLSVEAPGTYQHCLVVGSLAEAAAQAINANGLFCRVSTLYHDIGKLFHPHYFTENQMGGFNIHQLLTPLESTQVIIAHVLEGETLARKHGLPQRFIDIIKQHHGTTLVYYFYCKQVEQMGGNVDVVDENQFRYPGPKPLSKESAIIMMADSIEAASRSLKDVSEKSIIEFVHHLMQEKLDDGQFDECKLTFEEFGIIKHTFIKILSVARHLRIKYPKKEARNHNHKRDFRK